MAKKISIPKLASLLGVSKQRIYNIIGDKSPNNKINKKLLLLVLTLNNEYVEENMKIILEEHFNNI